MGLGWLACALLLAAEARPPLARLARPRALCMCEPLGADTSADVRAAPEPFSRTDRAAGRLLVARLLSSSAPTPATDAVLDAAKTLLYSGAHELSIELYAGFADRLLQSNASAVALVELDGVVVPVVRDARLLLLFARALLLSGAHAHASRFVRCCLRTDVPLGAARTSALIADLAPEALQLALELKRRLVAGGGQASPAAFAALIEAHADDPEAERTALALVAEYAAQQSTRFVGPAVACAALRVVFRAAAARTRETLDRNLETDEERTSFARTDAGLLASLALLRRHRVRWDGAVADCLLAETLRTGHAAGVRFVARQMRRRGLQARASSFRPLLEAYAASGDAEAALRCVDGVMSLGSLAADAASLRLALGACMRSSRGRALAPDVVRRMLREGLMDKRGWDALAGHAAWRGEPFAPVLRAMALQGHQPDERTVLALLDTLREAGRADDALALLELQLRSGSGAEHPDPQQRLADSLPPPSPASLARVLEFLRDEGRSGDAQRVLGSACDRLPSGGGAGRLYLRQLLAPGAEAFALAMEASLLAGDADGVFAAFRRMEALREPPTRRVFACLIRAFGLRGDVYSCIGVFSELLRALGSPGPACLHALLQSSVLNPSDVRLVVPVLEELAARGDDLEDYSKDLLMQSFADARQLGAALVRMETQLLPDGCQRVRASFAVLSSLVQAVRTKSGVPELVRALLFLGMAGVAPDAQTMDYFSIPDAPALNSVGSSDYSRKLAPNKEKKRSALDLEAPAGLAEDFSVGRAFPSEYAPQRRLAFVESGEDVWREHFRAICATVLELAGDDHDWVDQKGELVAEDFGAAFALKAGQGGESRAVAEESDVSFKTDRKGKRKNSGKSRRPSRPSVDAASPAAKKDSKRGARSAAASSPS